MKRSVLYDLPDWPGWVKFMNIFDNASNAPYPSDSRLYGTLIFETGCRLEEVIKIKPEMFFYNDEAIIVKNVPLLKKKKRDTRDIVIKIDDLNPLAPLLIEYVELCESEYLLPGRKKFTREIEGWRHISPKTVYNRISEIHPDLWPHALRGYRASMLVAERGFSVQDLVTWFEWSSADMALHYTRTKDIAQSMGIRYLPR